MGSPWRPFRNTRVDSLHRSRPFILILISGEVDDALPELEPPDAMRSGYEGLDTSFVREAHLEAYRFLARYLKPEKQPK